MEILVCVKRVPDTSENEIEINSDGNDIERLRRQSLAIKLHDKLPAAAAPG